MLFSGLTDFSPPLLELLIVLIWEQRHQEDRQQVACSVTKDLEGPQLERKPISHDSVVSLC